MKKIFLFSGILFILLYLAGCSTLGFGQFDNSTPNRSDISQNGNYTFKYKDDNAKTVSVAGDFNNWDKAKDFMKKVNGIWTLKKDLSEGEHQYKFVIDGEKWIPDPNNKNKKDDGYGGFNSVIVIGKDMSKKVSKIKKQTDKKTDKKTYPVKFSYQPLIGGKHEVSVAGSFNNWDVKANPLKENNGIYETVLNLPIGKYQYKFYVDGKWITDENAKEFEDDGFGGQNSVIYVGDKNKINALHKVDFVYHTDKPIKEVYIAGAMNDWNQKKDKLKKIDENTYKITLLLQEGKYPYKFVVNGTDWVTDKNADLFEDDGFGGKNSVIVVNKSYPIVTIKKNDGVMLTYGIPTEQSIETVNQISKDMVQFKTKAHKDDIQDVFLWKNGKLLKMKKIASDGNFDYFSLTIKLKNSDEKFDYYFVYKDKDKKYYLLNGEITKNFDKDKVFHFDKEHIKPFLTPDWAKNGIIYQIFMDRFYNGDKSNDQDFHEWYYKDCKTPPPPGQKLKPNQAYYHLVKDWYDISGLKHNPLRADGKPDWWSFYGGDIAGVRKKLDYLTDLGITIIYFNPIFEAKSNHKYDAADYMKVDPHFGTEQEFKDFVKEAHKRGIHIILDVALNHTGDTFWAFVDSKKYGPKSKYYHWYEWKKWPIPNPLPPDYKPSDYYECWWGFGEMPDLDYDLSRPNPAENGVKDITQAKVNWDVVNYLKKMVKFWIKDMDIDGFRLDVPNEVPFWFWELFRKEVKSLKPDAYLVGEIWSNASEWVNDKYFDAVMNYAYFKDPVMRFFNQRNCSSRKFDRDLKPGLLNYPVQATQVMMNLIDSHDTFRYLETAKGDYSKLKMAVLFEMTYVGIPHIWYGDEIGMMGAHDPDNRRPFYWKYKTEPKRVQLRNFYKKLINIRKQNSALRTGDFKTLLTEGKIYAYQRENENQKIVVILNNKPTKKTISLKTDFSKTKVKDLLSGIEYSLKNGVITITLPSYSGAILK